MYEEILQFWFAEVDPKCWWAKDAQFDARIIARFADVHRRASACECFEWRSSPRGRLAEIIVLDQFSRNMFRDRPESFAQDALALALAQEAVGSGADRQLSAELRDFLYMPYMHSESPRIHEEATNLFAANGVASTIEFERRHRAIIDRFGRYPHRNAILGRASSPEERSFLEERGSSF